MSDADAASHPAERWQFDAWPPALREWFDGRALAERTGFTASLVTANEEGRLGTALLGIGELYAPDPRSLRLALWAQSRATHALCASGRAALTFVFDGAFYQAQLDAAPLASDAARAAGLACFAATLASAEAQRVPYARLDAGILFTLEERQREATLLRWAQQVEWLKAAR